MEVLIINGTDYSDFIATKGYGWSRNDLDSDKTTRTKDGKMRRDKITSKRKLNYTTRSMPAISWQSSMMTLMRQRSRPSISICMASEPARFIARRWNARLKKRRTTMRCGAARRLI